MDRKWQSSIGFTATTLPQEITEELRFRIPAGDWRVLRKLGKKTFLEGRVSFQGLQNMVMAGPRWTKVFNDRVSMSLGTDAGFWFGFVKAGGINTKGSGWHVAPQTSFGYRFNKQILLTFRAEVQMNFGINTYAGNTEVESVYPVVSGSSYYLVLEQPFYGNKSLALGFRAIYTNFYWQTWTLFEAYDRNIFFPQLIVALIL
jgi:hypothetical protein